jgi:hypothetical protein
MKLHLDINCASLDDLKSARATIERLIQEHEERQDNDKFVKAVREDFKRQVSEKLSKIANPPLRDDRRGGDIDVVTDDATGEQFKCEPLDMDQWKCIKCGSVWDVRAGDVCRCGYRSDGKNMCTRSEVIADRARPHVGCCERYADMKGCDCLETALPDCPEKVSHQCPSCGDVQEDIVWKRLGYRCKCGHRLKCDECGSINCRQPSH